MSFDWKITYMNYSGEIVCQNFIGTLYDLSNFFPPNGSNSAILKIEKIQKTEGQIG